MYDQTYTKKEVEKLVKEYNKRPVLCDENGDSIVEILFPFRLARGKWVVLRDKSVTSAVTFKTTFTMRYRNYTVKGESQEDCLLKIIACLTRELEYGSNK